LLGFLFLAATRGHFNNQMRTTCQRLGGRTISDNISFYHVLDSIILVSVFEEYYIMPIKHARELRRILKRQCRASRLPYGEAVVSGLREQLRAIMGRHSRRFYSSASHSLGAWHLLQASLNSKLTLLHEGQAQLPFSPTRGAVRGRFC